MADAHPGCPACGTELGPALLACTHCERLVHADELKRLAAEATAAQAKGQRSEALQSWRRALELLPPGSRQHADVAARAGALSEELERSPARPPDAAAPGWAKLGSLGVVGLLLWKFKFIAVFVLSKLKLLLLGLTKMGTLLSMFASLGVYWAAWGWKFALGLVVSMYIHEMGHVAALQRLGIRATAPMFIPGVGAFVRMQQYPASPREDARVGLAGPLWGLGAALAAYALHLASGNAFLAAIAEWGARLNLFNLIPLGPLDGGRGFRSMTRSQRFALVTVMGAALAVSGEGMLWLLLLVGVARAFAGGASRPDWTGFGQFVLLVVALSALSMLRVAAS